MRAARSTEAQPAQRGASPRGDRFAVLLAAIFLLIVSEAVLAFWGVRERPVGKIVAAIEFAFILGAAAAAIRARIRTTVAVRVLAALAVTFVVLHLVFETEPLFVAKQIAGAVLLAYAAMLILRMVFTSERADFDTIAAALCVYMMLAFLWAGLYQLLEIVQPGSVRVPPDEHLQLYGTAFKSIYFSLVTLTTLGFGDFAPVSGPARLLVVLEAVVGQLFLVVLVARLVGLNVALSIQSRGRGTQGGDG